MQAVEASGYIVKKPTGRAAQTVKSVLLLLRIEATVRESEALTRGGIEGLIHASAQPILEQHGYVVRLQRTRMDPQEAQVYVEAPDVHGLIFVGGVVNRDLLEALRQNRLPFIVAGSHVHPLPVDSIMADYLGGMMELVTHLIAQGRRRIALVNGPCTTTSSEEKQKGFLLALARAGICGETLCVSCGDFDAGSGYAQTRQLLKEVPDVDAIAYAADTMAIGGISALRESGRRIPQDVAVTGFYDYDIARYTDPPLTTVRVDFLTMGAIAARRLLMLMNEPDNHRPMKPEGHNFWWLEVGGAGDTIADAEANRDELLKIAYGVWAYIKNHPDGRGHCWELEWIGALPGKRENVRYVGDHILTQNDILAGGPFEDIVAYGGWPMDDHHPDAIHYAGKPTIFHKAPSPYGIPYRSLYSRNIGNLFFAGRNISATHMALSSTRVMGTCALLGQAAGTAAAVAAAHGVSPRGVYEHYLRELQERLMDDDSWLPGLRRPIPEICQEAQLFASVGDPEPLRNGIDRSLGKEDNGWWAPLGESVTYYFGAPTRLNLVRLVFDSDLHNLKRMPCSYPRSGYNVKIPHMMTRAFDLEILDSAGQWQTIYRTENNYQRLVKVPLTAETAGLRLIPRASWGGDQVHLFGFDAR